MHAHVHLQYFSYQKTCLNIFKFLLHILLLKKEAQCNQKLGKKYFSFRPFLFSTNTNWPEQQIASLSARKSQHKRVISQIGAKFLHRKFEAVSDSQVFDCSWIVLMCKSCESVMADAGWPSFLLEIRRPPTPVVGHLYYCYDQQVITSFFSITFPLTIQRISWLAVTDQ